MQTLMMFLAQVDPNGYLPMKDVEELLKLCDERVRLASSGEWMWAVPAFLVGMGLGGFVQSWVQRRKSLEDRVAAMEKKP